MAFGWGRAKFHNDLYFLMQNFARIEVKWQFRN